MIGTSDSVMIFGIGILWILSNSLKMSDINIHTKDALGVIAFITLLIASLTKAGAFPLHTWVPDYAETAPASSTAMARIFASRQLCMVSVMMATHSPGATSKQVCTTTLALSINSNSLLLEKPGCKKYLS